MACGSQHPKVARTVRPLATEPPQKLLSCRPALSNSRGFRFTGLSMRMINPVPALACILILTAAVPSSFDEDPIEVDIAKLVAINYEEGKPLPQEIQDLDKKRVVIRGFMDPAQQTPDRLKSFRLVTDSCGCVGKPQVNHYVEVTLKDFDAAFQANIVELEGVLSVGEVEEDGFVTSIYRLEATALR